MKRCAYCGEKFEPRNSYQKFCSANCREKFAQYHRRKPGIVPPRKCLECGREFEPMIFHPNQKFCSSECSIKYRNKPAYGGKPQAEPKPPRPKPTKPTKPTKPLDEWIREARECNLDYGNYRALIAQGKTFDELFAERDKHSTAVHQRAQQNRRKEIWL